MVGRQHETVEYRTVRKNLKAVVIDGRAFCSEPKCLMPSRWIPPNAPWDVSHDTSGRFILGPSHRRCNRAEAATRGNKSRAKKVKRLKV